MITLNEESFHTMAKRVFRGVGKWAGIHCPLACSNDLAGPQHNLQPCDMLMVVRCRDEAEAAIYGLRNGTLSLQYRLSVCREGSHAYDAKNTSPTQGRYTGPYFKSIFLNVIVKIKKCDSWLNHRQGILFIHFNECVHAM